LAERILVHRANSWRQAEQILADGKLGVNKDMYGTGAWTCSDEDLWVGGPVQFKVRVTYQREGDFLELPKAQMAWSTVGTPEAVDAVLDTEGIDVVIRGAPDYKVRQTAQVEIIGYRRLEPAHGQWHSLAWSEQESRKAALSRVREWQID